MLAEGASHVRVCEFEVYEAAAGGAPLPAVVWLLGAGFLGYLGLGYSRRNETA